MPWSESSFIVGVVASSSVLFAGTFVHVVFHRVAHRVVAKFACCFHVRLALLNRVVSNVSSTTMDTGAATASIAAGIHWHILILIVLALWVWTPDCLAHRVTANLRTRVVPLANRLLARGDSTWDLAAKLANGAAH